MVTSGIAVDCVVGAAGAEVIVVGATSRLVCEVMTVEGEGMTKVVLVSTEACLGPIAT